MKRILRALEGMLVAMCMGCGDAAPPDDAPVDKPLPPPLGHLTLDTNFASNGTLLLPEVSSTDCVHAAAYTADGGILVAGTTGTVLPAQSDGLLAKFTPDGQLDTSYGTNGFAIFPWANSTVINGIEALADGSAVISGAWMRDISHIRSFLARIDPHGVLDPSFGAGGFATFESAPDINEPIRLVRAGNGDFLLLTHSETDTRIWRFDANGQPVTSFGSGGDVVISDQFPRNIEYLPDGKILLLTVGGSGSSIFRMTANGTLDATFGTSGKIELPIVAKDVKTNAEGELLVSSFSSLHKFDTNGNADTSFGNNGVVDWRMRTFGELYAIEWLPNGDIFALDGQNAGIYSAGYTIHVFKFAPDGTELPFNDVFKQVFTSYLDQIGAVLQKDGHFVFAGSRRSSGQDQKRTIFLAAMQPDSSLVSTFGNAGISVAESGAAPNLVDRTTMAPDGSILVSTSLNRDASLTRVVAGQPDSTFGTNGSVPTGTVEMRPMAVDAQGRILVQSLLPLASPNTGIDRYLPNGMLDPAFGQDGQQDIFPKADGYAFHVGVDSNNRIWFSGVRGGEGAYVGRLLDDGQMDTTFNSDGFLEVSPAKSDNASAMFIESNDKVVVAIADMEQAYLIRVDARGKRDTSFGASGKTNLYTMQHVRRIVARRGGGYWLLGDFTGCASFSICSTAIVALDADANIDTTFGKIGTVVLDVGQAHQLDIIELPDWSIVVAGALAENDIHRFALWKLLPTGELDPAFGTNGRFILPTKGIASSLVWDGSGVVVGGSAYLPALGSEALMLRFAFAP